MDKFRSNRDRISSLYRDGHSPILSVEYVLHMPVSSNLDLSKIYTCTGRVGMYGVASRSTGGGRNQFIQMDDILAEQCSIVHHRIGLSILYLLSY